MRFSFFFMFLLASSFAAAADKYQQLKLAVQQYAFVWEEEYYFLQSGQDANQPSVQYAKGHYDNCFTLLRIIDEIESHQDTLVAEILP
jgi:hypothetical protein